MSQQLFNKTPVLLNYLFMLLSAPSIPCHTYLVTAPNAIDYISPMKCHGGAGFFTFFSTFICLPESSSLLERLRFCTWHPWFSPTLQHTYNLRVCVQETISTCTYWEQLNVLKCVRPDFNLTLHISTVFLKEWRDEKENVRGICRYWCTCPSFGWPCDAVELLKNLTLELVPEDICPGVNLKGTNPSFNCMFDYSLFG